jgi:Ca2+-binding RTX toxin-like protein
MTTNPYPLQSENQVNQFTNSTQSRPSIDIDADGDYIVTWQSYGQDGSLFGIHARRYDKYGTPIGNEFRFNTTVAVNQLNPQVAVDDDGDFVITWQSAYQDGSGYGIYAQRYNASGIAQGAEFRVNTFTNANQANSSIALDADGDFVIAWQSANQDGSGYGIYGQRYNRSGVAQGNEFRINTTTAGNQARTNVATDDSGDFVVTWSSYNQDGSGYGIYARRYNASGVVQGGEFRVNTTTAGNQLNSKVALNSDGDFVIVWQSGYSQDGNGYGIYAQRYNASGVAQGNEFRVNSFTIGNQANPDIAIDSSGDFTITWASANQDGSGYGVYGQRYNAAGVAVGGEFRVNSNTNGNQVGGDVAVDNDGDFVVAWTSDGQDGSVEGIYTQRFDNLPATVLPSTTVGNEFQVNTFTNGSQDDLSIAIDADGDFVITWESFGQDGDGNGIYAQRYNAAGVKIGNEFQVNTTTNSSQNDASIAIDADGDFVIVWESYGQDGSGNGIYAQRYNASGVRLGSEFRVNTTLSFDQSNASIAIDTDGDFVIVWESFEQDGDGYGIYAQRYNAAGVRIGGEFQVNTFTNSRQNNASIAIDADGDFVIAWQSFGQDGDSYGIYAQLYNAAGVKIGSEFRVNTTTNSNQNAPSIAIDADGDFVIAWESRGQDGSGDGVYAQRYNAAGIRIGGEFQVNTFTNDFQDNASIALDRNGNLVVAWESFEQDGSSDGIYAQRFANNIPNSGNNSLLGTTGNDVIYGLGGNDTLDGGAGNDTLDGGTGNDTYIIDSLLDVVNERTNEGTDTVQASVNYTLAANLENLNLTGTGLNGIGNTANNLLSDNGGNNTFDGGAGNDTIQGNAGNDVIINSLGVDSINGGDGNDTFVLDFSTFTNALEFDGSNDSDTLSNGTTYTSIEIFNLTSGAENDLLIGGSFNDNLLGSGGDDYLDGSLGNDSLDGGIGNDTIFGNLGNDTLLGGIGDDSLDGHIGNDSLGGGDGNDTLNGSFGNDSLDGGIGNDTIDGDAGADSLVGGAGNDSYYVDNLGDIISENASEGTDKVKSTITYTLSNNLEMLYLLGNKAINGTGNILNNLVKGNDAANTITGGSGNDTLTGNDGNDVLVGGLGNDSLAGNSGADTFTFNVPNEGIDRISDFSLSQGDSIAVSASGFGGGLIAGTSITADRFVLGSTAADSFDRFIYNNTTGALFFDADGTGSIVQVQIATLNNRAAINNTHLIAI